MAKRQTAYVLRCQTPNTRRPLASDDIGDDQRIKHSDDDRPGLTRPTSLRRHMPLALRGDGVSVRPPGLVAKDQDPEPGVRPPT